VTVSSIDVLYCVVGMQGAIVSNPTVLVNTSVPPPNFLPQATSIQSHIIQLGKSVTVYQ